MNPDSQQVLDSVDAEDRVIGTVRRGDVFRLEANFRVAHLFLFNDRSEILLQRLAASRERHPGRWGSSVAAYLNSGESYWEAILRRTREELGISLESPAALGKTSMADRGCTKCITAFSARRSGLLAVDKRHIAEVRFLPVAEVLRDRKAEPRTLTPTFIHLLDLYGASVS